jgi:hypothetical protein
MLTALLNEAGDVATAAGRADEARACYLKGLHLLLDTLARQEVFECPDFVPRADAFLQALGDAPLPLTTEAKLMQHYERAGEFGHAEDAFYRILDAEPANPAVLDFGIVFYERLKSQTDGALAEGNLPRRELDAGLADLRRRRSS